MEKASVALVRCTGYEPENVYQAMKQGLELLGGIGRFVSPQERILIKPNLLLQARPEKAITTHPTVFQALARILTEEGYSDLTYGDSSGFRSSDLARTVETCGLAQPAAACGIRLGDFNTVVWSDFPQGRTCRRFPLSKAVSEAEAIISVGKMKTHALENITGAVKNQYGCISGYNKAAGHAKYPNSRVFAQMLCDLNQALPMRLFILDGIVAMEGNGPSSGDPIAMNVLLLSSDPVALDAVFAGLIDLDPAYVPTCVMGERAGLGKMKEDQIVILTPEGTLTVKEAFAKYGNAGFNVNRKKIAFWNIRSLLPSLHKPKDRPVVDLSRCIGCGICEEACPVEGKAVRSGNGTKAVYDYSKCIRCYCCQEMCPAKAISRK